MSFMKVPPYPETPEKMYAHLRSRLGDVAPEFELRAKAELACEINRLKQEKRAVILGHNYMEPGLYHSVPDFTGDSLYLSRVAAKAEAGIIVFCGVRFMAETAKILSPTRKVLLPSSKGGCSLAQSLTAADVVRVKALYPGAPVVTYVNCYADVKAESDYCCTSGNAAEVVRVLLKQGCRRVIFLPDEYLARNVARECAMDVVTPAGLPGTAWTPMLSPEPAGGRPVMIAWKGRCEVHEKFTVEDVRNARKQFPDVVVLAHPECHPDVIAAVDIAGSTSEMLRYLEEHPRGRYLLLTECSMADNIASRSPQREMLRLCSLRCPHMGEITLEETLASLREERYVIEVPAEIRDRARLALDRMLQIG
jgi:quinolinate synthase